MPVGGQQSEFYTSKKINVFYTFTVVSGVLASEPERKFLQSHETSRFKL